MSGDYVILARASDIPCGEVRVYQHGELRIAVCNVEGTFHAVEDVCTHDDGPLGAGTLSGCAIECPRHGAKFDVRTGEVLQMPAVFPIRTFEVKVEQDNLLVKVNAHEHTNGNPG